MVGIFDTEQHFCPAVLKHQVIAFPGALSIPFVEGSAKLFTPDKFVDSCRFSCSVPELPEDSWGIHIVRVEMSAKKFLKPRQHTLSCFFLSLASTSYYSQALASFPLAVRISGLLCTMKRCSLFVLQHFSLTWKSKTSVSATMLKKEHLSLVEVHVDIWPDTFETPTV